MLKQEHRAEHHDRKRRVHPKRHETHDPHRKVHRDGVSAPKSPRSPKKAKKHEAAKKRRQEVQSPDVKKRPDPSKPKDQRRPVKKERRDSTSATTTIPLPVSSSTLPLSHCCQRRTNPRLTLQRNERQKSSNIKIPFLPPACSRL